MKTVFRSMNELKSLLDTNQRPICLFSGGLDGAYLLTLLSKLRGVKPVAVTVDVGSTEDRGRAAEICDFLGIEHIHLDEKERYARNFVLPALQAQAQYLGTHPISASLTRPLLALCAKEIAKKYESNLIVHTANSSQNSLRRFNGAIRDLGFTGYYGTPYELTPVSREEKKKFLSKNSLIGFAQREYSVDTNLWCREFESGDLDNSEDFVWPEKMYEWSRVRKTQDESDHLEIEFENGVPVSLNGEPISFIRLIDELNSRVGAFGHGRYMGFEEIEGGTKFLEMREMPAAFLLLDAYRKLESAVYSAELIREKMQIEQVWVREAVEGRWFGPLKKACEQFIQSTASRVEGLIRYRVAVGQLEARCIRAQSPVYGKCREEYEIERLHDASPSSLPRGDISLSA